MDECSNGEPTVEEAFVDDDTILLAASTPEKLDAAIDIAVATVKEIFHMMRMQINWKPGKTECFLVYRGKDASKRREERRRRRIDVDISVSMDINVDTVRRWPRHRRAPPAAASA